MWRDVCLITTRYCQSLIAVDGIHKDDPVRRLSMISQLLHDYRGDLEPYASRLREEFNAGPNDWIQRIVGCIFGLEGATNDRAWWARTLTEWWEEWRVDEQRTKFGF